MEWQRDFEHCSSIFPHGKPRSLSFRLRHDSGDKMGFSNTLGGDSGYETRWKIQATRWFLEGVQQLSIYIPNGNSNRNHDDARLDYRSAFSDVQKRLQPWSVCPVAYGLSPIQSFVCIEPAFFPYCDAPSFSSTMNNYQLLVLWCETPRGWTDNGINMAYDLGCWSKPHDRNISGSSPYDMRVDLHLLPLWCFLNPSDLAVPARAFHGWDGEASARISGGRGPMVP